PIEPLHVSGQKSRFCIVRDRRRYKTYARARSYGTSYAKLVHTRSAAFQNEFNYLAACAHGVAQIELVEDVLAERVAAEAQRRNSAGVRARLSQVFDDASPQRSEIRRKVVGVALVHEYYRALKQENARGGQRGARKGCDGGQELHFTGMPGQEKG